MSVIKPPTIKDLIEAYGSEGEAVNCLVKAGFSPEQIEWKTGIPYYRILLYMNEKELGNGRPFAEIIGLYERLAVLRGKRGKETTLASFFQNSTLPLEMKIRFALGKLAEDSLKVGPGLIERCISLATGASLSEVRKLILDYGEHAEAVYLLKSPSKPQLTVEEVYEALRLLPKLRGMRERELFISSILRVSSASEAKYIIRLLLGDLKLGYHENTVIKAASRAYNVPQELIRNACSILGVIEGLTLAPQGLEKLSEVRIRPGIFIKPQLAHLYEPDKVAYPARAEYKLDGSRLQIHKWGNRIWLYSRRGIEKSQTLPEVVEIAGKFKAQTCIVDGEVIAVDASGNPLSFQALLERTVPKEVSREELEEQLQRVKVTVKTFDILYLNGRDLTKLPLSERRKYLLAVVPDQYVVDGVDCNSEAELMLFYDGALKRGYEGIVVKDLKASYEVGKRTFNWLKLKPERDTIDCTIVKALYGKGRRAGLYSSFLLAVRDPVEKKLYTIGRVSNLPETVMDAFTEIVEQNMKSSDEEGVFIKPAVVVEVTYQEIQVSEEYTSGYALRAPKIVRFRMDKSVDEIDMLDKIRRLYELQYERYAAQTI